jgi:hypothetical protein
MIRVYPSGSLTPYNRCGWPIFRLSFPLAAWFHRRRFVLPAGYTFAAVLERYPRASEIRWLSMGTPTRGWTPEFVARYGPERFEVIEECDA